MYYVHYNKFGRFLSWLSSCTIYIRNYSRYFFQNIYLILISFHYFDVQRTVHRNIISIAKPTRCTNVSNLFYFGMTLYMFRTVFPSVIRSSRLYITSRAICQTDTAVYLGVCQIDIAVCLLANRQQYLFDKCLLLYVQSWTADDGQKDRPKHVECQSKIK